MNKILALCPYCGKYWYVKDETITNIGHKCNFCMNDGRLINTKHEPIYFVAKYMTKDQYQLSEHLMNNYVRCNPLYSPEFEEKRIKVEAFLDSQTTTINRKLYLDDDNELTQPDSNIPHCPTCGSTDIEKISAGSKIGKAALFGVFSISSIGKTYQCKNCNYKF